MLFKSQLYTDEYSELIFPTVKSKSLLWKNLLKSKTYFRGTVYVQFGFLYLRLIKAQTYSVQLYVCLYIVS